MEQSKTKIPKHCNIPYITIPYCDSDASTMSQRWQQDSYSDTTNLFLTIYFYVFKGIGKIHRLSNASYAKHLSDCSPLHIILACGEIWGLTGLSFLLMTAKTWLDNHLSQWLVDTQAPLEVVLYVWVFFPHHSTTKMKSLSKYILSIIGLLLLLLLHY